MTKHDRSLALWHVRLVPPFCCTLVLALALAVTQNEILIGAAFIGLTIMAMALAFTLPSNKDRKMFEVWVKVIGGTIESFPVTDRERKEQSEFALESLYKLAERVAATTATHAAAVEELTYGLPDGFRFENLASHRAYREDLKELGHYAEAAKKKAESDFIRAWRLVVAPERETVEDGFIRLRPDIAKRFPAPQDFVRNATKWAPEDSHLPA